MNILKVIPTYASGLFHTSYCLSNRVQRQMTPPAFKEPAGV